jgi:hypothetical protein
MEFEKFKKSCEKGFCLRSCFFNKKTCRTNKKQEQCFTKYLQSLEDKKIKAKQAQEKKIEKQKQQMEIAYNERALQLQEYLLKKENNEPIIYDVDEKWVLLKNKILVRDQGCRFYQTLSEEEKSIIDKNLYGDFRLIDGAHVVPRSVSLKLKYEEKNVYCLSRYVHKCLDECMDPFTQLPINRQKVKEYWIRIIGEEIYNWLQKNK